MADQKEEAKIEKFIKTMPMMIQTHLITCKDWAAVKDTAKSLEHIIRKFDPPTPAMPMMTTGATVPGLGRGKPKGKLHEQRQNPPKAQEADETYAYESLNNYYHNDNYNAPSQSRDHRPFTGQGGN